MPALKSCVLLAIAIGRKTNSWLLLYTLHRYSRYANKLLALWMSGIRLGYEAVSDPYKITTNALCKWQEVKLPALKWSIDWESHNLKCVSSLYKPTTPADDQKIINLRTYKYVKVFHSLPNHLLNSTHHLASLIYREMDVSGVFSFNSAT